MEVASTLLLARFFFVLVIVAFAVRRATFHQQRKQDKTHAIKIKNVPYLLLLLLFVVVALPGRMTW